MKSPILAKSQEHAAILKKMRKAHHCTHIEKYRDVGFLPEGRNSFTLNRTQPPMKWPVIRKISFCKNYLRAELATLT